MHPTDADRASICQLACQNILRTNSEAYKGMELKADELLYHYTDVHGLIGIIQDNSLWATEAGFLSDPLELHHSANLMKHAISQYSLQNPHLLSDTQLEMLRLLPRYAAYNSDFRNYKQYQGSTIGLHEVYVVISFSTSDDSLLLWREYADKGNGYAIAMAKEALEGRLCSGAYSIEPRFEHIRRVLYADEEKAQLLWDVIFSYIEYWRGSDSDFEVVANCLNTELGWLLPMLKPAYYSDEREVRYVADMSHIGMFRWSVPMANPADIFDQSVEQGMFRRIVPEPTEEQKRALMREHFNLPEIDVIDVVFGTKSGIVVPHVKLKPRQKKQLKISEIVIGPSLNHDMAELGLRRLADRYYFPGFVHIRRSTVPYRSHL